MLNFYYLKKNPVHTRTISFVCPVTQLVCVHSVTRKGFLFRCVFSSQKTLFHYASTVQYLWIIKKKNIYLLIISHYVFACGACKYFLKHKDEKSVRHDTGIENNLNLTNICNKWCFSLAKDPLYHGFKSYCLSPSVEPWPMYDSGNTYQLYPICSTVLTHLNKCTDISVNCSELDYLPNELNVNARHDFSDLTWC